jgi:hypothetical protein
VQGSATEPSAERWRIGHFIDDVSGASRGFHQRSANMSPAMSDLTECPWTAADAAAARVLQAHFDKSNGVLTKWH